MTVAKTVKTKHSPVGILLKIYARIYLKFKLQLKFRKDKNCTAITVNMPTDLQEKTD